MSIQASSYVWQRSRAKGSNLLMLLAIADYAKDDGRWAFPSARTLAWKARLTNRAGELILAKLVEDGEVWPEVGDGRLYLHIRCICEWADYQVEGPAVVRPEKISHSSGEKFSRRLVGRAQARAKRFAAASAPADTSSENEAIPSIRSVSDPSDDPYKQGTEPDQRSVEMWKTPERGPLAVLVKLAHTILDRADTDVPSRIPDWNATQRREAGDVRERLKELVAWYEIPSDAAMVSRAYEAASWQRKPRPAPQP